MSARTVSRRNFLKRAGIGAATVTIVPRHVLGGPGNLPPSESLGGALIGFVYLKADWRGVSLGRRWKDFRYQRRVKKVRKKHRATRKVMDDVDRVLDRINEVGYEGLTRDEKRILEEASELLSRKHDS